MDTGSLLSVRSLLDGETNGRERVLVACLAWMRREQKAATKTARFDAHFNPDY
jgi:hypothetical protein